MAVTYQSAWTWSNISSSMQWNPRAYKTFESHPTYINGKIDCGNSSEICKGLLGCTKVTLILLIFPIISIGQYAFFTSDHKRNLAINIPITVIDTAYLIFSCYNYCKNAKNRDSIYYASFSGSAFFSIVATFFATLTAINKI